MIELIYIGQKFYRLSDTRLSSLYEKVPGTGEYIRRDWGKVTLMLEQGQAVTIRPATPETLAIFQEKLINILEDKLNE